MRFAEVLRAKMKDKSLDESSVQTPRPRAESTPRQTYTDPTRLFSETEWQPIAAPHPRLHRVYPATDRSSQVPKPTTPEVKMTLEPLFQTTELSTSERDGLQFLILNGAGGLSEAFTKSHLRREYRKLVKRFHPDSHHAAGTEAITNASEKFLKLQEAKQNLSRLFL